MIWVQEGIITDKNIENQSIFVVSNNPIVTSRHILRKFGSGPSIIDKINQGDIVEFSTLKVGNHIQWAFDLKKLGEESEFDRGRYKSCNNSIDLSFKSKKCTEFEYMDNPNEEFLNQFEKKSAILQEMYPIIRENLFICAFGDRVYGYQALVLRKINPVNGHIEIEDCLYSVHDNKPEIEFEKSVCYQEIPENLKDINKENIRIHSNGILKEICLKYEEKFQTLNSWAAYISKWGLKFYKIQEEINQSANLEEKIGYFILVFLLRVDSGLLLKFIENIAKEPAVELDRHESCLIVNLTLILGILYRNFEENMMDEKEFKEFLSVIMSINPPVKIFTENPKFTQLILHYHPDLLNNLLRLIKDESGEDTQKLVSNFTPIFEIIYPLYYHDYYPGQIVSRIDEEERYLNLPLELFFKNPKFVNLIKDFNVYMFEDYLAGIFINYQPNSEELFEKLGVLLNFIEEYYIQLYNEEYFYLDFREFLEEMYALNPPDELFLKNPDLLNIFLFTGEFNLLKKLEKQINSTLLCYYDNDPFYDPGFRIQDGSVTELSLTNLKLTDFPLIIFEFKELEYLSLNKNQIKKLPLSIDRLQNLKSLNISNNKFTKIPDSISKMTNLKRIWVENNNDIQIPEDIEHLLNDS